jgi:Ras-related protein Rab-1A
MRSREFDCLLKLVIVGNSAVGKSSLLLRFADGTFNDNYFTTIGVDFRFKTLNIDSKNIKLQIWDTAGQEKFRTITNTYYKNAQGVILVFDLTSKESLDDLAKYWINEVESYADPDTRIFLIGNKKDMAEQRVISEADAEQFARERKLDYFETSAKTDENVRATFEHITRKLYQEVEKGGKKKPDGVRMEDAKKAEASGCARC